MTAEANLPGSVPEGHVITVAKGEEKQDENPLMKESLSVRTFRMPSEVSWAWEHKSGMKPYDADTQKMIEKAYRGGRFKVRLKTGKEGKSSTPKEIFFEDLVQYDPISDNKRNVQRVGPWTFKNKLERFFNGINRWVETGERPRQNFDEYQERRQALHDESEQCMVADFEPECLYRDHGLCASIANNPNFFGISMLVVCTNAVWIAVDLDRNEADFILEADLEFQVMEYLFIAFFSFELIIRFCALKEKCTLFTDKWLRFDLFLVCLMIFEAFIVPLVFKTMGDNNLLSGGILSSLSALRLLRLLRLQKVFRMVPQLMCQIQGVIEAIVPMFYTCVMLVILVYVFGVIFRSMAKDKTKLDPDDGLPDIETMFRSVTQSCFSLFLYGTLLDGPANVMQAIWADIGPLTAFMFLVFIVLSSFTVLNMLIGIVCEVVSRVNADQMEETERRYLQMNLLDVLKCYDKNNNGSIAITEFNLFLDNPEVHDALMRFGTSIEAVRSLAPVLFDEDGEQVAFNQILQTVMNLKSDNIAKVADIVSLREFVRQRTRDVASRPGSSQGGLESQKSKLIGSSSADLVAALPDEQSPPPPPPPWEAVLLKLDESLAGQERLARQLQDLQGRVMNIENFFTAPG